MLTTRRTVTGIMAATALAASTRTMAQRGSSTYDVAVVGAGSFGAWTAYALRQAGQRVCLIDAYGPANSRASSGGESRIIRSAYGAQAIYSRWAMESLVEWKALQARNGTHLFEPTGVLAIAKNSDSFLDETGKALMALGLPHERLSAGEVARRFPAFHLDESEGAVFEPNSGALLARRAIQTLVAELVAGGMAWRSAAIRPPKGSGTLPGLTTATGETISAGRYVFACGPWLPKVFPDVIGAKVRPDRAEVFFLGVPEGSTAFEPGVMPTWLDQYGIAGAYGFPNLEARGCKVAVDGDPVAIDPDLDQRTVTTPFIEAMREFVAFRFPALAKAPIVETRVCQYEMAKGEEYILDRHPGFDNVWIAGGGSGHGFKNGPRVGRYMAQVLAGSGAADPRFSIAR